MNSFLDFCDRTIASMLHSCNHGPVNFNIDTLAAFLRLEMQRVEDDGDSQILIEVYENGSECGLAYRSYGLAELSQILAARSTVYVHGRGDLSVFLFKSFHLIHSGGW